MKKNKLFLFAIQPFFLISLLWFVNANGQIPGITPSMLSDFSMMSPSEKRELAKRYGVDLEEIGIVDELGIDEGIGTVGAEIKSDTNDILIQRIINSQNKKAQASRYRNNNIPIFSRDLISIDELPIYGAFLFDGRYSTYAPVDNIPVPSDYILGTGDSLRVLLYGIEDSEIILVVNREGAINFPQIGSLNVAGMTFEETARYIESRVKNELIGTEVNISLGRLKSINVFMAGEAKIPGNYSVSGLSSVSQLLFVAGGMSDIGSLRNSQVRRSGQVIANFDLYKLLTEGKADGDIRLQSGDIIFIPPVKKTVYIDGAVNRVGRYELKENETISSLISFAGGLKNRAFLRQLQIERYNNDGEPPSIINLDYSAEESSKFLLEDGDIIRIASIGDDLTNSVTLMGAVKRPGKYGYFKGITFTDLLNSVNQDFSNNFDMTKALIVRRKNLSDFTIEVIDFNVKDALDSPKSDADPKLNLYDQILVFSLGHNNDLLNDIEVYNPDEDISHPLFGKEEENEVIAENLPQEPSLMTYGNEENEFNMMTDKELRVVIHETKKLAEYDNLNKGKRRLLLEPIIKKLNQQASSSDSAQVISISGAVKVPGDYPLTNNNSYDDLIKLAGGYSDDAYIDSAELRRTVLDSSGSMIIETIDINLDENNNSKLQSKDHLHVRNIKDWDSRDSVTLAGEVFYPGNYLISPNETLSSVIRRAGGFTNESFIEGAVFTRESIKEKEREQLQILGDTIRRDQAARSMTKESEDFSVSSVEVEAGISALLSSAVYGRLIIDIPRLISGDISADIVLQDGDVLSIPKFTNAVTVVGEVRRSGSFVRQDSYNISDYLELAAGMSARGDAKEIYIIKANGSVQKASNKKNSFFTFTNNEELIQAGDTIVVPIKSSYQTPLNLYSTVSQVVFQSIASIAAFSSVFD
tara:strand:- start:7504 stop:10275 length:2772 start_codon:yes stop_codon:yes gene_type:complete